MEKLFKNKLLYTIYSFCFLILAHSSTVLADVGNHSSYSSSDDGDGILWILFFLIDIFGFGGTLIIIVIGAIIFFVLRNKNIIPQDAIDFISTKGNSEATNIGLEQTVISKINSTDPYFDSAQFKSKVTNMYISLQEAWEQKNWKIARPFESDQLFRVHSNQLMEYIQKEQTNVMDRVCVNAVDLLSYNEYPSSGTAQIRVKIKASQIDYIKDDRTNRILMGNPKFSQSCIYEWVLVRSLNVKSNTSNSGTEATCCPSCGAPLSIGMAGTCEYCNANVTTGQYDWVLNEIRKLN